MIAFLRKKGTEIVTGKRDRESGRQIARERESAREFSIRVIPIFANNRRGHQTGNPVGSEPKLGHKQSIEINEILVGLDSNPSTFHCGCCGNLLNSPWS